MAMNKSQDQSIEQARALRRRIAERHMMLAGVIGAAVGGAFLPFAEIPILQDIKRMEKELSKVEENH